MPRGKLVIVVGSVGSGKSSLLAALLGVMPAVPAAQQSNGDDGTAAARNDTDAAGCNGSVIVRGSIGYTQQDPFIQNATVRDNILMGSPLDDARYGDVLDACALRPDLDMLPAGKWGERSATVPRVARRLGEKWGRREGNHSCVLSHHLPSESAPLLGLQAIPPKLARKVLILVEASDIGWP